MNYFKKVSIALILVMLQTPQRAASQRLVSSFFPEKSQVKEVKITGRVHRIVSNSRSVSIISYPEPGSNIATVQLLQSDGIEIWNKKVKRAKYVYTSQNSNASIIVSYSNSHNELLNTYYDSFGNKIWEINVTDPGLTMSSDGIYGITTRVGGEGDSGHFRVYDLRTGEELQTPIVNNYKHFFAKFIDSRRVIVMTQSSQNTRVKGIREKIRAIERDLGNLESGERQKEWRRRRKELGKVWNFNPKPLNFIIYDIPTRTILTREELYTEDGYPVWTTSITAYNPGNIWVSKDRKSITIAANGEPLESQPVNGQPIILQIDVEGKILWERKQREPVKNIGELDGGKLVVMGSSKVIYLLDASNGEMLWRQEHGKLGVYTIQRLFLDGDKIALQLSTADQKYSVFHLLDLKSGQDLLPLDFDNQQVLLNSNPTSMITYDKSQRKVIFSK